MIWDCRIRDFGFGVVGFGIWDLGFGIVGLGIRDLGLWD